MRPFVSINKAATQETIEALKGVSPELQKVLRCITGNIFDMIAPKTVPAKDKNGNPTKVRDFEYINNYLTEMYAELVEVNTKQFALSVKELMEGVGEEIKDLRDEVEVLRKELAKQKEEIKLNAFNNIKAKQVSEVAFTSADVDNTPPWVNEHSSSEMISEGLQAVEETKQVSNDYGLSEAAYDKLNTISTETIDTTVLAEVIESLTNQGIDFNQDL